MLNKLRVIALLLPFSLLSGCNGITGSGNSEVSTQSNAPNTNSVPNAKLENPSPATGNAVRVARWSQDPKGRNFVAPLTGRLAIVNNCLVVSNKDAPPTLLIFPYGIGVWDDANQTFTYEGKVIGIGETIETGGGRIDLNTLKEAGIKYDVPDCGITDFWLAN